MRACVLALLLLGVSGAVVRAEDPSYDQLKKLHEDSLKQLEIAQTRKNELSAENDQLRARVADVEKQLAAARGQAEDLQRQAAEWAERTYFYRAHYAAWRQFIRNRPALMAEWDVLLEGWDVHNADATQLFTPRPPTTAPATAPATQPTTTATTP